MAVRDSEMIGVQAGLEMEVDVKMAGSRSVENERHDDEHIDDDVRSGSPDEKFSKQVSVSDGSPGEENGDDSDKKNSKKHRRGRNKGGSHHRRWKPYYKLSWDERQRVDERETERATTKRQERFDSGHPLAPYNTTQFLMDDHSKHDQEKNPNLHLSDYAREREASGSTDSGDEEFFESPNDEDIFLAKEFSEAYQDVHAERLQTMSKVDLVRDYLELEGRIEKLQKRLLEVEDKTQSQRDSASTSSDKDSLVSESLPSEEGIVDLQATKSFTTEITRLKTENGKLRAENDRLKVVSHNCVDTSVFS